MTRRLSYAPYAQAKVEDYEYYSIGSKVNSRIVLVSYATVAAVIDNGVLSIRCMCSRTTCNHVRLFLKEYCPEVSYELAKELYYKGLSLDLTTGEIL